MIDQDSSLDKAQQRAAGIAARRALSMEERRRKSEAIAARICGTEVFDRARIILSYRAMKGEADPSFVDEEAKWLGKEVAYPISLGGGRMVAAVPKRMEKGMYGIEEPAIEGCRVVAPGEIDLILVPCTAFDERCRRIGMGSGYYDRFLPLCRRGFSVALAFAVQQQKQVAAEPWDLPLAAVATENAWYAMD